MRHLPFLSPTRWLSLLVCSSVLALTILGFFFRGMRSRDSASESPKEFEVPPAKAEILAEVEAESIAQTIDGLPTFSDQCLAAAASGVDLCPDAYSTVRLLVPRLTRVRKLLGQIGEGQRARYVAEFLEKIDDCARDYPRCWEADLEAIDKGKGVLLLTEPTACGKKRDTATALAYILTEWDRPEALPAFAKLLELPDPIPVNRLFLLYSAHILVLQRPTAGYSQDRLDRLTAYTKFAKRVFPDVGRTEVTAWDAKYDETDFRAVLAGEPIPITAQPTIRLRYYPDVGHLEDFNTKKLALEADALQRMLLLLLRTE